MAKNTFSISIRRGENGASLIWTCMWLHVATVGMLVLVCIINASEITAPKIPGYNVAIVRGHMILYLVRG